VDQGTNSPTGDPNGPDGEVELDIEVSGAVAPGAQIGAYFAPNTDRGFIDALTAAIHDGNLRPSIISISWGSPESSWTDQARNAMNSACQDAATMGVTVLVASGDHGATDGLASGTFAVDYPSSSPFVIGCGGTKLALSGNTISSEQAWNELAQNEGATGGGVSDYFPIPNFQTKAGVPTSPKGFRGRGVPDVAGDADPTTGYNVFVDGQWTVIGGTSAVAPLWAGLLARINMPKTFRDRYAISLREITEGIRQAPGGILARVSEVPMARLCSPRSKANLQDRSAIRQPGEGTGASRLEFLGAFVP